MVDCNHPQQAETALMRQAERSGLLALITQRIRQSLHLETILNTTAALVREFLAADRVILFQFDPDWKGRVVVESVGSEWMPILGALIYDPCFEQTYGQLDRNGWVRVLEDIEQSNLSACYVEFLRQFQVRASLVVPILQTYPGEFADPSPLANLVEPKAHHEHLWGLLIAHQCRAPREWHPLDRDLLEQLATQVAIAIQQAQLYAQVQHLNTCLESQVQQRTQQLQQALEYANVQKRITEKIRDSVDETVILQTIVKELAELLQANYCCTTLYNLERSKSTVTSEQVRLPYPSPPADPFLSNLGLEISMDRFPQVYKLLLQGQPYQSCAPARRQQQFGAAEPGDLLCARLTAGTAATLLCPIAADQEVIGDIGIFNQGHRLFTDSEIQLVQQVASQCAIGIRQARLYQAAQHQVVELERLNRLKDDFLSTVSHELRTPMSNIKMAAYLLKRAPIGKDYLRYVEILEAECLREIDLINNLLDLQHLDPLSQSLQEMALQPWLAQLMEQFQAQAKARNQHLELEIAPQLPVIRLDPNSLQRILSELVSNACKHSPTGSLIRLAVATSQGTLIITVSNPADIPGSELPRIFDKFYRIPKADPWNQGGTGLGLALVQQLVRHLQGDLQVSSQEGLTIFTLKIPFHSGKIAA